MIIFSGTLFTAISTARWPIFKLPEEASGIRRAKNLDKKGKFQK